MNDRRGFLSSRHGGGDEAIEVQSQLSQSRSRYVQLLAAEFRQFPVLFERLFGEILSVAHEEQMARRRLNSFAGALDRFFIVSFSIAVCFFLARIRVGMASIPRVVPRSER